MKRVVIVGGGVIGLSCGVRLRQGGAQVTVLDAEREHPSVHGPIASAAAAGMLAPIDRESSPHEKLALQSFDLWRSRQVGAEWADGVRFDGAIVLHESAGAAQSFIDQTKRLGRNASPMSTAQVRKRSGLHAKLDNAVFVEDEGVADPLRVLTGLAMQARAMGAIIEYERDVASVSSNSATTHEGEVYEADVVVLAPGVWATDKLIAVAPALKHIRPAKGQLVSVALQAPLGATVRGGDFYIAQRREDVVLGASLEFDRFDRVVDPAQSVKLLAAAERVLPGEVTDTGRAWAGVRPMSPDGWPMIGPTGEGLLVAAGHSRNGWLLAPITAEIISAYVFGVEVTPEWGALAPSRFGSQ